MEKKTGKALKYFFWIAVAAVLLYFCLRRIDWPHFTAALQQCRWGWVLLSMALGVLSQVVRALRWRLLLRPLDEKISFWSVFNAYNICMAVNLAVPRAGELVRMGYVARDSKARADNTLGTIVVERVWDVLFVLLLTGVVLLVKWEDLGRFMADVFSAGTPGKNFLLLAGAFLLAAALLVFLSWRLREKGKIWAKLWGFMAGIGNGLVTFRKMKGGWLFILYTFAIWAIYWFMSAAILWALKGLPEFAGLGMADALLLSIAGSLSSIVPVPGGFGAYHGMVAGMLTVIWGIPLEMSMVFAVLNHESQVLTQALYGLGSYIHENFIRKEGR